MPNVKKQWEIIQALGLNEPGCYYVSNRFSPVDMTGSTWTGPIEQAAGIFDAVTGRFVNLENDPVFAITFQQRLRINLTWLDMSDYDIEQLDHPQFLVRATTPGGYYALASEVEEAVFNAVYSAVENGEDLKTVLKNSCTKY